MLGDEVEAEDLELWLLVGCSPSPDGANGLMDMGDLL